MLLDWFFDILSSSGDYAILVLKGMCDEADRAISGLN